MAMLRSRSTPVRLAAGVLVLVAASIAARQVALAHHQATQLMRRRALYAQFPIPTGARLVSDQVYEITCGDGGGCGDYGLRRTYQLPTGADANQESEGIRTRLPAGWTVLGDQACQALEETSPPLPPPMTEPGGATIPTPSTPPLRYLIGSRRAMAIEHNGRRLLTVTLERRDTQRTMVLDQPTFACGPNPDPGPDPFSIDANAPPGTRMITTGPPPLPVVSKQ